MIAIVRTALAALFFAAFAAGAEPPGGDDWKYDIIHRKTGKPLQGLVLDEGPRSIKYLYIARKPGAPTILVQDEIARSEVERIERLDPKEHSILEQRVKALRQERITLQAQLKALDPASKVKPTGDRATLKPGKWPADTKVKAVAYESTHFRLVSTAREELVQLAAIQLEQVYAAYVRAMPPRVDKAEATTILLTQSQAEYQALISGRGHNLLNPAFYDSATNQIVCGNDLQRQADKLEELRNYHAKELKKLDDNEKELRKTYKGKLPPELKDKLDASRQIIKKVEEQNNESFNKMRQRLFQRLRHEAFHAYLTNFVYPSEEGELPRWLNEGLAQIFETAIFEIGELRIGHADKERLEAAQQALAKGTLLPLIDLLKSGSKQFQVTHAADQHISDRYYLASWALAYQLTFDKRLLGTSRLDNYVKSLKRGSDSLAAFQELIGMPLSKFEKEHHDYLKQLRPDGSVLGRK